MKIASFSCYQIQLEGQREFKTMTTYSNSIISNLDWASNVQPRRIVFRVVDVKRSKTSQISSAVLKSWNWKLKTVRSSFQWWCLVDNQNAHKHFTALHLSWNWVGNKAREFTLTFIVKQRISMKTAMCNSITSFNGPSKVLLEEKEIDQVIVDVDAAWFWLRDNLWNSFPAQLDYLKCVN